MGLESGPTRGRAEVAKSVASPRGVQQVSTSRSMRKVRAGERQPAATGRLVLASSMLTPATAILRTEPIVRPGTLPGREMG